MTEDVFEVPYPVATMAGAEQGATASRFSPNRFRNGTSKVEQQRLPPTTGLTMTSSPADLMRRNLLEVFNEPDPARRAAVIAVTYAEAVSAAAD